MRESELVYRLIEDTYTEGYRPVQFAVHTHMLRGQKGAVTFSYVFPADMKAAREAMAHLEEPTQDFLLEAQGRGVDYHSPVPLREWQKRHTVMECRVLDGKPCYGDGSSLLAVEWLEEFQTYGAEWLRDELAQHYHRVFYGDGTGLSADIGLGETIERLTGLLSTESLGEA